MAQCSIILISTSPCLFLIAVACLERPRHEHPCPLDQTFCPRRERQRLLDELAISDS